MHIFQYKRPIYALSILILASLACNLFNRISSTPVQTATIPITTEAAGNLVEDLSAAAESLANNEQVTLVIDEIELTSLVALELQKQPEPVLSEPQIYLRDGQIQVFGKVQRGGFNLPSQIYLTVTVDSAGNPQFKIQSAKVGPMALSESMLNEISGQIDALFTSRISPRLKDIYIENITIVGGMMTIQGHTR